jgi:hypothetical protein
MKLHTPTQNRMHERQNSAFLSRRRHEEKKKHNKTRAAACARAGYTWFRSAALASTHMLSPLPFTQTVLQRDRMEKQTDKKRRQAQTESKDANERERRKMFASPSFTLQQQHRQRGVGGMASDGLRRDARHNSQAARSESVEKRSRG